MELTTPYKRPACGPYLTPGESWAADERVRGDRSIRLARECVERERALSAITDPTDQRQYPRAGIPAEAHACFVCSHHPHHYDRAVALDAIRAIKAGRAL